MLPRSLQGQRGFTLIELLAVIAILTVLSGIVAGAVTGIGASGQNARLVGDADTIGKAADRFFNDAFPQAYPVLSCCGNTGATSQDILEAGDLGVRLIDFEAVLPGNPTKSFVPDFLKEIPDTAALVSWRIVKATGQVFFAQDGAQLVLPSTARLNVSAAEFAEDGIASGNNVTVQSDYTFKLRMNKNEAALEIVGISIPAGYSIGGQFLTDIEVGGLKGKLSTDNPWYPGQVKNVTGTLKTTNQSNEWLLEVNYSESRGGSGTGRADRAYKVSIATPSVQVAGALKIELTPLDPVTLVKMTADTAGDKAHNQATETWELTIKEKVNGTNVITNPAVKGVYRWLAAQHTSIDVGESGQELFSSVAGNQAVVIKESTTPTLTPTPTPTSTPTPPIVSAVVPFASTGDLYVLDQGSKNILRITRTGVVSIAVTQAQIQAATQLASVSFFNRGIAFDGAGTLYFTESVSGSILRRNAGGTVSVLAGRTAITAAAGGAGDPRAIAFGSDGFLYVNDNSSNSVLRLNPSTGAVGVFVSKAVLEALTGTSPVNLAGGIVGDASGNIYVVSAPATGPQAVLKIASGGTPSVLVSGSPFRDLDVFITRVANGDLLVADDSGADTIHRVIPTGVVSTFVSKTQLELVTGALVDLEGGIALDSSGSFYLAEANSDSILRFDTALTGEVWVPKATIQAVTNAVPDLQGGIAFAPS